MHLPVLAAPHFGAAAIRTVQRDGELWFIGRDVAQALGYKNSSDAMRKHVDSDEKGVAICDTPGGKQRLIIISELGVYGLILGSELDQARPFKKWVKLLIQRYRQGDITLADEVLQRNTNAADAEWLAARAAVKAGRAELTDVLSLWHAPENRLIENVSKLVTRAVIGRSPSEYREAHGLKKSTSIRDHFTYTQLADMRWLESKLAGVLVSAAPTDHKEAYQACKSAVEVIYGVIHAA